MTKTLSIAIAAALCASAARADDAPRPATGTAAQPPAPAAPPPSAPPVAPPVAPPAAEPPLPAGDQPPAGGEERDPFSTTPYIQSEAARRGSPAFTQGERGPALTRVTLRGYLEIAGREPSALIEVEGAGVHIVHAGETLTLYAGGRASSLRILRIEHESVSIEMGTLGQVIVVR